MFKNYRKLWLALGVLVILSPLGLIAAGTPFGEWGVDQLEEEVGFIPTGLERLASLWTHAPLVDYGIAGFNASFMQSAIGYIISAGIGIGLVIGVISILSKFIKE